MRTVYIIIAFAVMVVATITANVLMKLGGASDQEKWVLGLFSTLSVVGVCVFGFALLIYMRILEFVPLNVAQSIMAIQFIGIVIASALLLNESIPTIRWAGVGLIAAGIVLVGVSTN